MLNMQIYFSTHCCCLWAALKHKPPMEIQEITSTQLINSVSPHFFLSLFSYFFTRASVYSAVQDGKRKHFTDEVTLVWSSRSQKGAEKKERKDPPQKSLASKLTQRKRGGATVNAVLSCSPNYTVRRRGRRRRHELKE